MLEYKDIYLNFGFYNLLEQSYFNCKCIRHAHTSKSEACEIQILKAMLLQAITLNIAKQFWKKNRVKQDCPIAFNPLFVVSTLLKDDYCVKFPNSKILSYSVWDTHFIWIFLVLSLFLLSLLFVFLIFFFVFLFWGGGEKARMWHVNLKEEKIMEYIS